MRRLVAIFAALGALFCAAPALAQSGCSVIAYGVVLTPQQWQSCFEGKLDNNGKAPFLPLSGGTMTGKLVTAPTSSAGAGIALPEGTAPGAPINGDLWMTPTGIFAQISGTTLQLALTPITGIVPVIQGGSGAANWTAGLALIGNGANTFTQSTIVSSLSNSDGSLLIPSVTGAVTASLNPNHTNVFGFEQFFAPSTAGQAGINIGQGATPNNPVNGEFWNTTGGFFGQSNGYTEQFLTAPIIPSGISGAARITAASGGSGINARVRITAASGGSGINAGARIKAAATSPQSWPCSTVGSVIVTATVGTQCNGVSGTGAIAAVVSPAFTTPNLGAATATSINFGGSTCSSYAAGTWTPALTTNGTAGTPAYSIQTGSYEQTCRQVTARFTIELSGWTGSPSGNVEVSLTGLPAIASGSNDNGVCTFGFAGGSVSSTFSLSGWIQPGTSVVLVEYNANQSASPTILGATPYLVGMCSYHV